MQVSDYVFAVGLVTDFHGFLFIEGWFYHPDDQIVSVELKGPPDVIVLETAAGFCYEGVKAALGDKCGFRIKAFAPNGRAVNRTSVVFRTAKDWVGEVPAQDLANDGLVMIQEDRLYTTFRGMVAAKPGATLLDIGGRSRSGIDRSKQFETAQCTVFDVNPGENVDVVGDAHKLSKFFPPETFDFVQSISVFEHLAMPWVVATELNRVLKIGGHAFISTHQSVGCHDYPWDFWRFSDRAFHALFCGAAGFEVVEAYMSTPNFIVPFIYSDRNPDYEKTAGFEVSCALVRKVRTTRLNWTVDMSSIHKSVYPG